MIRSYIKRWDAEAVQMPNRQTIDMTALEAGAELGQKAFGIIIQPRIDEETSTPHAAMYDFRTDGITVFANGIEKAVEAGGDAFHVVRHAVAHELGHAREARYFAECGLFPYRLYIGSRCVIVAEGGRLSATGFSSLFDGLINTIQDFAIDKTLSQYGVKDQIARLDLKRTKDILNSLGSSSDKLERIRLRLQTVFNLPLDMSHYRFGDIAETDKKGIRELAEKFLGTKKWQEALDLISGRRFGDVEGYKRMVASYMHEFLGVTPIFRKRPRVEFGNLPNFWNNDVYETLFVE